MVVKRKRKGPGKKKPCAEATVNVRVTVAPGEGNVRGKRVDEMLVAVIIDESGSMEQRRNQVVSGFNEYVDSLRKEKRIRYRVSLTKFNTASWVVYSGRPLGEVPRLDVGDYNPSGGTALVDATCNTLNAIQAEGRPVLVLVMTDGEENASQRWTSQQMKDMILSREGTGRWTFVYLGADQNAWANAERYGFHFGNTIRYDSAHTGHIYRSAAVATANLTDSVLMGSGFASQTFSKLADFDKPTKEEKKDSSTA